MGNFQHGWGEVPKFDGPTVSAAFAADYAVKDLAEQLKVSVAQKALRRARLQGMWLGAFYMAASIVAAHLFNLVMGWWLA